MDETFIRSRVTKLRTQKGVSEYKMSTDLGRSKGYIQSISCGRVSPSMAEFFCICEYLGVAPSDFFDESIENPAQIQEVVDALKILNDENVSFIVATARHLIKQQSKQG